MIKGQPADNASEIAKTVYLEFKAKDDWPDKGSDAERREFAQSVGEKS